MNVQIQSSFKRSDSLNQLINHHLYKLNRFYDRISYANIFLKKEQGGHISDKVTLQLFLPKQKGITITEKSSRFEAAIIDAFERAKRQLKRQRDIKKGKLLSPF